ncbi:MAG: carboxypeptidase regulatory-like domain-containing protein [Archangium sp.]|nr:carboxypeptidase regulatory-like domain-containing protein [Archangium sp.]
MRRLALLVMSVALTGCFDLALPGQPGPGTIQGRLVYQVPGQRLLLPAAGAQVELLSSSLTATADGDGRFLLEGLTVTGGVVLARFDLEGDGAFERQRALDLRELKAGAGRDVALGEVVLNRNAAATGRVRRGDVAGPGGHGGISVFVPELGFQTYSGDNGDWVLEELPEGTLPVAFFARGYAPQAFELTSTSASPGRLREVSLSPSAVSGDATATGLVTLSSGEALPGVSVRALSFELTRTVTSSEGGEVVFSAVTPGVYSLAYEKAGFETVVLRSVLLAPGENALQPVSLREGTSVPWVSDFELPDGGLADGGMAFCLGQCAAGFGCTSTGSCRSAGCESQSCALCSKGRCLEPQCAGGPTCAPGEVCEAGACVPLECAGVSCPAGRCVSGGSCLPTQCTSLTCAPGLVCSAERCVHPQCVGKACPTGTLCAEGSCLPRASTLTTCAAGFVRKDGTCVEAVCQGAACAAGASCRGGACVAEGLFAAGIVGPRADLNLWESVLAANLDGTWRRLNVTALPKVRQLAFSLDGRWLFAVGEDDTLRRSLDGITWTTVWTGTLTSGGLLKSIAVFPDGQLYGAVVGGYGSGLTRVIRSADDGSSWATAARPIGNFNGDPDLYSVAPPDLMSYFNATQCCQSRAVQRFDGGVLMQGLGAAPRLVFDPQGFGPTLVAEASLLFLDGGVSGPVSTGLGAVVYSEAPRTFIWAASAQSVWKSPDHGLAWGSRSTATPASLDLTSLVQGVDGTLYAGNRKGTPSLLASVDDGETWLPIAPELARDPGLSDRYDTWQPDASYGYQALVIPTQPNGFFYEKGPVLGRSTVEPQWSVDGGVTVDAQGASWAAHPVLALRVSALASRSCSLGTLRCGGACVDVAVDAAHCGACGNACPGPAACVRGACETVAQAATVAGCADGTREGFIDLESSPALAACAGSYAGALTDPGADLLCAPGWHVCRHDDPPARAVTFAEATGFPGCFAMRASTDDGDGCEPLDCSSPSRDDLAGMGAGCAQLSGVSRPPSTVTTAGGCLADRGIINTQCCSVSIPAPGRPAGCPQRGEAGVLCCAGP